MKGQVTWAFSSLDKSKKKCQFQYLQCLYSFSISFLKISPHLRLHHCRPLRPERPDGLEDVHDALVLHPLKHEAQGHEDAGAAHAGRAVDGDGALLDG